MRVRREVVEVGGYPVRYKVAGGRGEPVILVHGLSGSTHWWSRNVEALAQRYQVYIVDLPGFGSMRRMQLRQGLRDGGAWLARWMDALGLLAANLVGHSMGGYICLRLAATRPDLVKRLALVAPAVLPASRSILSQVVPLISETAKMSPQFFAVLGFDALRAGPVTLLRSARDLLDEEVRHELALVRAPTLLIWGENDAIVPASTGLELQKHLPHARLLILRGANHVPMYHNARRFNAALLGFFRGDAIGA